MISDKELIVWRAPSLSLEATEAKGCEACEIAKRNLSVCQEATGECSALETTSLSPLPKPKERHKRGQKECKSWGVGWGVPWNVHARTWHSLRSWTHPSCVFLHKIVPPSPFHHGGIHETSCLSEARVTVTVNSSLERKHHFLCGRATGHFPSSRRWYPTDPCPCGPP